MIQNKLEIGVMYEELALIAYGLVPCYDADIREKLTHYGEKGRVYLQDKEGTVHLFFVRGSGFYDYIDRYKEGEL